MSEPGAVLAKYACPFDGEGLAVGGRVALRVGGGAGVVEPDAGDGGNDGTTLGAVASAPGRTVAVSEGVAAGLAPGVTKAPVVAVGVTGVAGAIVFFAPEQAPDRTMTASRAGRMRATIHSPRPAVRLAAKGRM